MLQPTNYNLPTKRGFTLIEMMLSVATIGIMAGMAIPIYQSFQMRNDLDIMTVEIAQTLRRAQVLSQAVDGDISWGVKIQNDSLVLFKGISYIARDTSFDEMFEMPLTITPSGMTEVIFTKFSGWPQTTGTTTLTSNNNETRTITINTKGMVSY